MLARTWKVLVASAVLLAVGPAITRVIDGYRAVILDARDGELLVQRLGRPPAWVSGEARPGDVVVKERGRWGFAPASSTEESSQLLAIYRRYASAYEGTVVSVAAPAVVGAAALVVVEVAGGVRIGIDLWTSPPLGQVRPGARLRKVRGAWDPELERPAPKAESRAP